MTITRPNSPNTISISVGSSDTTLYVRHVILFFDRLSYSVRVSQKFYVGISSYFTDVEWQEVCAYEQKTNTW
jgi:hypothetical protein